MLLLAALSLVLLNASAQDSSKSQSLLDTWDEETNRNWGDLFGLSLCRLGDLDGDGRAEYVVGCPNWRGSFGTAWVFSGADGSLRQMIEPEAEIDGTYFGCTVAAGPDANGDGVPEVLVAARGGEIRAYSPLDGELLWKSAELGPDEGFFGPPVVSIGDVTADGCTDVAVGQFREGWVEADCGLVRVLSGRDGTLTRSITPGPGVQGFASSLLPYPDVDGDGASEIVVNSPSADSYDIHVISTRDGAPLLTKSFHLEWDWIEPEGSVDPTFAALNYFREHDDDSRYLVGIQHLSEVVDRDADGFPEIAMCVRPLRPNTTPVVKVFSFMSEAEFIAPQRPYLSSITDAGDVDADGVPDCLVGGDGMSGIAAVHSGKDGRELGSFDTMVPTAGSWGAVYALANLGDLDGDGRDELAFSITQPTSPGLPAEVRIHSGKSLALMRTHTLRDSMRAALEAR